MDSIAEYRSNSTDKKKLNLNTLLDFFSVALYELDTIPYYYVNDEVGKSVKKKCFKCHENN